jgi:hypothetical protein
MQMILSCRKILREQKQRMIETNFRNIETAFSVIISKDWTS